MRARDREELRLAVVRAYHETGSGEDAQKALAETGRALSERFRADPVAMAMVERATAKRLRRARARSVA